MARYPGALWKPISADYRSTSPLTPDLLGLHTIVGSAAGTWSYFNTGSGGRGVYSHFLVHGKWSSADTDGEVWQCADTLYRAAANLNGNYRIISVETADNAPNDPADIEPWTMAQEAAIVDLMVWAYRTHGIPLVLVPDSKPGRRGICYHKQGVDPFRVAGGELWSTAYGKTCPTDARFSRIPVLIARATAIVNGSSPAPVEPDTLEEIMALYASAAAYEAGVQKAVEAGVRAALADWLPRTVGAMNGIDNAYFGSQMNETSALLAIRDGIANLTTLLTPPPPPVPAQAPYDPTIHDTDPADPTGV